MPGLYRVSRRVAGIAPRVGRARLLPDKSEPVAIDIEPTYFYVGATHTGRLHATRDPSGYPNATALCRPALAVLSSPAVIAQYASDLNCDDCRVILANLATQNAQSSTDLSGFRTNGR